MTTHRLHPRLVSITRPLSVVLVGCGGTGASLLGGLPFLHQSLLAFGHPGIHVTVFDPDVVSEANCVRQPFARSDIGSPKASVLVGRINTFFGFAWDAAIAAVTPATRELASAAFVLGAVDSRAARAAIHAAFTAGHTGFRTDAGYWLDLGNRERSGQFVIGSRDGTLPTVATLYPEMIDPTLDDPNVPSCTAKAALLSQAPFVNQTLAQMALATLADFLRHGQLTHHGVHWSLGSGCAAPIAVPALARMTSRRRGRSAA